MNSLDDRIKAVKRIRELGSKIEELQLQEQPLEKERANLHEKLAKHYGLDFGKVTNCKIVDSVIFELGQETLNLKVREGLEL